MRRFVMSSVERPYIFARLAVPWSLFQGYAGREYRRHVFDKAQRDAVEMSWPTVGKHTSTLAYGWHHGVLFFAC